MLVAHMLLAFSLPAPLLGLTLYELCFEFDILIKAAMGLNP